MEDGDYSARGFRNGGVIEEQGLPDQVRLREFRQREIFGRGDAGGAEEFGFEIVVRDQLIDTPEANGPEGGHKEVRVYVDKRDGVEFLLDGAADLIG